MKYKIMADIVAIIHAIIAFIILTLHWSFWNNYIAENILPMTLLANTVFLGCPLTKLENYLRKKYNPKHVMQGSFLGLRLQGFRLNISPILANTITILVLIVVIYFF